MRKTAFLDLAEKRRSVRAYKPDDVPEEMLQTVLEAGRLAPSACNKQPWRFIVVRSEMAGARSAPPMPATGSGRLRS